jgi:ribulose 1,5-bisphosphate synthetase/thiazole synthase
LTRVINTDVLVVGGGTSGCIAAIAAAEEGAQVVLLERDGALGGVGTRAGINSYWYGSTGGLQHRVDSRCRELAAAFDVKSVGFHPDAKRTALTMMVEQCGVHVWLHAIVFSVLTEDARMTGVMASMPGEVLQVNAKVTIDATGDGDVASGAGEAFMLGRDSDGMPNACSLVPRTVEENGKIAHLNYDSGFVDPTDPWDVSHAYRIGRQRIQDLYDSDITQRIYSISPQLGIREGRHIIGEYVMTWDDFVANGTYPDTVMTCHSHYDLHNMDVGFETEIYESWVTLFGLFDEVSTASVPYRCLVPKKTDALLVACRAFSVDRDASMAIRMQRDMQKLGEVAGVAAALAVREGVHPRQIAVNQLQNRLVERGVLAREVLTETTSIEYQFGSGELKGTRVTVEEVPRLSPGLIRYFGTPEEGKAIWWLSKSSDPIQSELYALLQAGTYIERRCAAFVLGVRGDHTAIPTLIEVFDQRDNQINKGYKMPRWIGALVLLRRLGSTAIVSRMMDLLAEERPMNYYSIFIKYFDAMKSELSTKDKERLVSELRLLVDRLQLRATAKLTHGGLSTDYLPYVELHTARLLIGLGDAYGQELCRKYLQDERVLLQRFAHSLIRTEEASQVVETSERFDAGAFQAVVYGGGIRGVMLAARLATEGKKTLLVERGGGSMGEVGHSRWLRIDLDLSRDSSEPAGLFASMLSKADGYQDGYMEPCLTQIVADQFLEQLGVEVLFEGSFLSSSSATDCHELALKGKKGIVRAVEFYFTEDHSRCDSEIWTLTLMNSKVPSERERKLAIQGNPFSVQFDRGFYENEVLVHVKISKEISLYTQLELIIQALRELDPVLAGCQLAHICDKPLLWSTDWESSNDLWGSVQRHLEGMFEPHGFE